MEYFNLDNIFKIMKNSGDLEELIKSLELEGIRVISKIIELRTGSCGDYSFYSRPFKFSEVDNYNFPKHLNSIYLSVYTLGIHKND